MTTEFYPIGPAAFEAPDKPSAPPVTVPVTARALFSNPLDYRLDAKGRLISGHPVDQAMALSLAVRKGSITSHGEVGNELHLVQIGTDRTTADVRDKVLTSYPLSRVVEAGDATILSITYEERETGGLLTRVEYRNERSGKREKAFFKENS